jgi:hypothetical protein
MSLTKATYSMISAAPINIKDYGAVGDGVTDDTSAINAALSAAAGKSIVFPTQAGAFYLVSDDLIIRSNTTVYMESGVVIKTAPNTFGTGEAIFKMDEKDNITIYGNGATLQGLREGVHPNIISFGVSITGSTNIRIYGLKCIDHSGDGFVVQGADDNTPRFSKDVWLIDCVAQNNMRQGLSIVSAKDLWVDNCRFSDTNGKEPSAGIDIESENLASLLGIKITNCIADNNEGGGFMIDFNTIAEDVDIEFQNCVAISGTGADATGFEISNTRVGGTSGWRCALNDCVAENTGSYGLLIRNINKTFDGVTINNFQAVDTNAGQHSVYGNTPVAFYSSGNVVHPDPGNIRINGLRIFDSIAARTPYYISVASGTPWDNIVITGLEWVNTAGTAVPYADDGITNTYILWTPSPFRVTRTSDTTLSARWSGWIIDNTGDTGLMTITLPPVAAGLSFSFEVMAAQLIRIDPNASDRLRPFAAGDGKYMESNTIGSAATVRANAAGTDWIVERSGTWVDEP